MLEIRDVIEVESLVLRLVLIHFKDKDVVETGAIVDAAVFRKMLLLICTAKYSHVFCPIEDKSESLVLNQILEPLLLPPLGYYQNGSSIVVDPVRLNKQVDESFGAVECRIAHNIESSNTIGLAECI